MDDPDHAVGPTTDEVSSRVTRSLVLPEAVDVRSAAMAVDASQPKVAGQNQ